MEQQFATARRLVIGVTATLVRLDMGIQEEHFAVANDTVRVGNARFAAPERLDLGPAQNDAGLERLEEVIVESRALVPRDRNLLSF
jgi:hypothetical protein